MTPLLRSRLAAGSAFFVQGLLFISLTTRLPQLQVHWRLSDLETSGLLLVVVLMAGVGSLLAEYVATRRQSATVVRLGFATATVGLATVFLAPSMPVFVTGLALYGLALGLVDASSNMQAVTVEHLYGRPLLPSFYGFWTAGGLVATILTLALGDTPVGPRLLPLLLVPLATLAAPFASKDRVPAPDAAADIPWRRIVLLGVAMVLFYMVDTAAETWGPTYLHGTLGAPTSQAALATLPYLLATLLARGVGDQLVDRLGAVVVLRLGAVVAAVALALIVLAPTWPVAVAGFAVLGGAVATIAPLSFSAAGAIAGGGDFASQQDRVDQVIARLNQFNYAGALLGSVLTGVVGAGDLRLGFAVPMVLVLGIIPLSSQFAVVRRSTLRMGRPPGRG